MNGKMIFQLVFWISAGGLLYVYIGYPLFLTLFAAFRRSKFKGNDYPEGSSSAMPTVSLVISARNEEIGIGPKIENCLALDYPEDKLEVIVASDGSTDRTNDIVSEYIGKRVKLVVLPVHSGKSSAQNSGVSVAEGEIIVFSDATGVYNPGAIKRLAQRFLDPRVGCVTGKVISQAESARQGAGTDLFRSYERFIRAKESILGNLAVATGSIFAIRRDLFTPLDPQLSDDFLLPLKTLKDGYRVAQEPLAVSADDVNPLNSVFRRRSQVISMDFRTLMSMKELLNPFRHPLIAWGLFSHKILRWLGGVFILMCFILSGLLIEHSFFLLVFTLQAVSYSLAIVGWIVQSWARAPRPLIFICNFYLSNIAALVGIIHHLLGKKTGVWEPVRS